MMKRAIHVATAAALAAFSLTACGRTDSSGRETSISQAARDFQDAVSRRLDDAGRKLEDLRARASTATADERARLTQLADDLGRRREKLAEDLKDLRASASEKWADLKAQIEIAIKDLEKAIHDALT